MESLWCRKPWQKHLEDLPLKTGYAHRNGHNWLRRDPDFVHMSFAIFISLGDSNIQPQFKTPLTALDQNKYTDAQWFPIMV